MLHVEMRSVCLFGAADTKKKNNFTFLLFSLDCHPCRDGCLVAGFSPCPAVVLIVVERVAAAAVMIHIHSLSLSMLLVLIVAAEWM